MNDTASDCRFTIDDIHAIRYANYERTKDMTHSELIEHTRREAQYGLDFLETLRSNKNKRDAKKSALMGLLEHDIMEGIETCKRELKYTPTRYLQMIKEYGVHSTIKKLIANRQPSEGYVRLLLEGRKELSVEFLVVKYAELFEEDEVIYCKEILDEK